MSAVQFRPQADQDLNEERVERMNNSADVRAAAPTGPWENVLSLKWYVLSILLIVVILCALIWGAYVPYLNHLSGKHIKLGDAFYDRARVLQKDAQPVRENIDELDRKIDKVFQVTAMYAAYQRTGYQDPTGRKVREIDASLKKTDKDIRDLTQSVIEMIQRNNLADSFQVVVARIKNRDQQVEEYLDKLSNVPFEGPDNQDYSLLFNMILPNLIGEARRVRDLFDAEACYDRAMQEYIDAIGLSRFATGPRLRMANLYRDRQWPEFAMMEYLRVIKLAPKSADARLADAELRKYEGQTPEADFHIALARLLHADYDEASKLLQRFLDDHPTDVLAPKAAEVLAHLRQNDHRFVKRYLRDEIWI